MYVINNAKTRIREFDDGIERHLQLLANLEILPQGRYALAGGAIRSIFDGTKTKDLDLYILGNAGEHSNVLAAFPKPAFMMLENPFSIFRVISLTSTTTEDVINSFCPANLLPGFENIRKNNLEIQIISLHYDSQFESRKPIEISSVERFQDTYATSLDELLKSFDLTICKAGIEFTVIGDVIAVSSVNLPGSFLTHVGMRKMAFSEDAITVPQQLCTIKRFHKYLTYGYHADEVFFQMWHNRVKENPHILNMSYANDF